MNGAELLLETARKAGIEVCFTNFGTSEVPLALAFDSIPGIRPVLGLFEGVCTGAADGWGRVKDRPAMTLLHLGPGLGNGLANLRQRVAGIGGRCEIHAQPGAGASVRLVLPLPADPHAA